MDAEFQEMCQTEFSKLSRGERNASLSSMQIKMCLIIISAKIFCIHFISYNMFLQQ